MLAKKEIVVKIFKKILIFGTLVLGLFPGQMAFAANGPDQVFMALTGNEARNFQLTFDLRPVKTMELDNDGSYARYQQFFGDAQVYGAQVTILKDSNGVIQQVIGNYYDSIKPTNFRNLSAHDAESIVSAQIGSGGQGKIDAMIDPKTGKYFFRKETRRADSRWFYLINAEDGQIINKYDGLMNGSGTGVLGDAKDLSGLTIGTGPFQMISLDGRQTTYDARNRNGLPGILATDDDDNWITAGRTSPGQGAIVDAQFYARVTDNYYLDTHGFNWLSHYPQGMVSSAHIKRSYNNAYWNGAQMAYGDGDGVNFINFSGATDVVGHELSHGVTEATSNLIYLNESGALNEAFSDMMGTAIEFYYETGNWTIGEDITPGSNGIRNMANPNEDGDPSHYADRFTGTSDNGGVHTNSGIANHWFYLLVNGGQNANPARASGTNVQGIGLSAAEAIAFLGFIALPSSANFCAARASTIAVAGGLGTNVADAWDEVGVDETLCSGGSDIGPVISNLNVQLLRRTKFRINWTTDVPSNSVVTFDCCGSFTNSSLVTSHSMTFTGDDGLRYTGFVESTDSDGNTSTPENFDFVNN